MPTQTCYLRRVVSMLWERAEIRFENLIICVFLFFYCLQKRFSVSFDWAFYRYQKIFISTRKTCKVALTISQLLLLRLLFSCVTLCIIINVFACRISTSVHAAKLISAKQIASDIGFRNFIMNLKTDFVFLLFLWFGRKLSLLSRQYVHLSAVLFGKRYKTDKSYGF